VDSSGNVGTPCTFAITVNDDEELDETLIGCGSSGLIAPCNAPLSIEVSYGENTNGAKANGCATSVSLLKDGYACRFCNGAGKEKDKLAGGSCVLTDLGESSFTIAESGGVGDHIEYRVKVSDPMTNGNSATIRCTICVDNPSNGDYCNSHRNNLRRDLAKPGGNGNKPGHKPGRFACPASWDVKSSTFKCHGK
jgi:hypothetical protein